MRAGFDTTIIPIEAWEDMKQQFKFHIVYKNSNNSNRYTWIFNDGHLVTSHNPVDGRHYADLYHREYSPGMVGYIGIEGSEEFVFGIFEYIYKNAEIVKDICLGRRDYI